MNTEIFLQRVNIIRPDLERLAKKKLGDKADAEDLVQEVLMRLWLVREKWETHQDCKPLAINILEHCVIDRFRKIREMEPIENQPFVAQEETPHQYTETKDLGRYIWSLIKKLPPLQQLIMRLKGVEELEVEEIAQITSCSPEAVRMNLYRARKKIRIGVAFAVTASIALFVIFSPFLFKKNDFVVINGKKYTDEKHIEMVLHTSLENVKLDMKQIFDDFEDDLLN